MYACQHTYVELSYEVSYKRHFHFSLRIQQNKFNETNRLSYKLLTTQPLPTFTKLC